MKKCSRPNRTERITLIFKYQEELPWREFLIGCDQELQSARGINVISETDLQRSRFLKTQTNYPQKQNMWRTLHKELGNLQIAFKTD